MTNEDRQTVIQALEAVDALIDHQFTGTSKGMTALQHACDDCREALGIMRREEQREQLALQLLGRKRAPVDVMDYGAPALRED